MCLLLRPREYKLQNKHYSMDKTANSGYKGSKNKELIKLSDDINILLADYIIIQLVTVILPVIIHILLLNNKYDYKIVK